jgi:hypothetical protein
MEILSKELGAVSQFRMESEKMLRLAGDMPGKGLLELTESFLEAISSFGLTEINSRMVERRAAIEIQQDFVKTVSKKINYNNEKGLRNLSYAYRGLKIFREDLINIRKEVGDKFEVDISKDLKVLHDELRAGLVDLDIKASDVVKIDKVITECFENVGSNGADGLVDYIELKLNDLEKIRKSPNRGAVENIPVWKVAAIAVAVGFWIWGLFKCHWWNSSCSTKESLAYSTIFWIACLVYRFC